MGALAVDIIFFPVIILANLVKIYDRSNRPVYQSYKNRADLKCHIMMGRAVKTRYAF